MSRFGSDVLLGVVLILFGLGALYLLGDIQSVSMANAISSSTLPSVYATLLAALSGLMVISAIVRRLREGAARNARGSGAAAFPWPHALRAGGTLVLLVTYVLALSWIPFFVATAAFLMATLLLYGRAPLWRVVLLALVAAGAFHWLFIELIKLPI